VQQIAARVGKALEQRDLIERDVENAWLAMQGEGGTLDDLIGHSITYRIAVGPRTGQKLFTLQTVPPREEPEQQGDPRDAAHALGFSLHAGQDIQPHQREKLERLCRYVRRPPIAVERLALTSSGQVRYQLKTPYRDGTTHIVLEPLDLMARLVALMPPPRMHLARFHGVFAPHSKLRAAVIPAHRGVGSRGQGDQATDKPITPRHVAMSWAQRRKRVFGIAIDRCARCQGRLRVIASTVIAGWLHGRSNGGCRPTGERPTAFGPVMKFVQRSGLRRGRRVEFSYPLQGRDSAPCSERFPVRGKGNTIVGNIV
jgi:hypothetical protein